MGVYDRLHKDLLEPKTLPSPSVVTGIEYSLSPQESPDHPSATRSHLVDSNPGVSGRGFYRRDNMTSSLDDGNSPGPFESLALDQVWESIRQEKERKMAKERPKVQSLDDAAVEQPSMQIPVVESQPSVHKSLTKQKSISNFRESTDGRSIVATFEMPPEIGKQDIHLSFQRNRLIVTWDTIEVSEWEERGVIMRERIERMFHRTLPLPEGTRFEEIRAVMNDRRLMLRYPNMRCYRVETRSRSAES